MAYTALEKMREVNRKRFGKDLGPLQPPVCEGSETGMDLKSAALRFLRERCEGLRFSSEKEAAETETGEYLGTSLRPNQIPYNMEMDINRRCLEKSLETFILTGTAENAYPVYYCFLRIFLGEYGESIRMVEMLSEYEENGSALLLKHRDHYSHSVYVFAMGLAVYETNGTYRDIFSRFYQLEQKTEAERANFFLEFWGLTALFHDIGYPFELPFEQALSYFEVDDQDRGPGCPYLSYHGLESLTALDDREKKHFEEITGECFAGIGDLLAWDIARKLGRAYSFPPEYLQDIVRDKPSEPERFSYFMDHAYFSAMRLYRELEGAYLPEELTAAHADVLGAILLHNSLFKFSVCFYRTKKTGTVICIPDSLKITDEAEMEAVLELVVKHEYYSEEELGTLSFLKAQWIAHNLAYEMATGDPEQKKWAESILGMSSRQIIRHAKELDISPVSLLPEEQRAAYELIELLYCTGGK